MTRLISTKGYSDSDFRTEQRNLMKKICYSTHKLIMKNIPGLSFCACFLTLAYFFGGR